MCPPIETPLASSSTDSTLQRLSLSEQALALLRKAMIAGEMRPGEIYSAAALASRLGVSNSPVREAMLTLVNEGLMEPIRNRGYRVIPFSESDVRQIYEIRLLLEVPAMEQLARRRHVDDVPRFAGLAEQIVAAAETKDLTSYLAADRDFHLGLTAQLGNDRLTTLVGNLRDQTRQFGLPAIAGTEPLVRSAREHGQLLDALIEADVKGTRSIMTQHLGHILREWSGNDAGAPSRTST